MRSMHPVLLKQKRLQVASEGGTVDIRFRSSSDSEFQVAGAATAKARRPYESVMVNKILLLLLDMRDGIKVKTLSVFRSKCILFICRKSRSMGIMWYAQIRTAIKAGNEKSSYNWDKKQGFWSPMFLRAYVKFGSISRCSKFWRKEEKCFWTHGVKCGLSLILSYNSVMLVLFIMFVYYDVCC